MDVRAITSMRFSGHKKRDRVYVRHTQVPFSKVGT